MKLWRANAASHAVKSGTQTRCPSCSAWDMPGLNPHFSWCLYNNSGVAFLSSIPEPMSDWPMPKPPPYPADDEGEAEPHE